MRRKKNLRVWEPMRFCTRFTVSKDAEPGDYLMLSWKFRYVTVKTFNKSDRLKNYNENKTYTFEVEVLFSLLVLITKEDTTAE